MFKNAGKSIRANMLIGLFLITPVVATLFIIEFLFTFITNHLVPEQWLQTSLGPVYRVISLVIVVLGLYFIGLLARNIIGKSLYKVGDYLLARIPIIRTIYIAIRQISESLVSSRSNLFKEVVAVEYPRLGMYAIGFVTSELPSGFMAGVQDGSKGAEFANVFLPTTPNPTSGFLLIVPRSDIIPLKISVTEGMKMIMSAGAVLPGDRDRPVPTLLDRLEVWLKHDDDSSEATPGKN